MTAENAGTTAIAFIGFGEAAQAFLAGWRTVPGFAAVVTAYDIKTDSPDAAVREGKRADYVRANVFGASTAPAAVAGAGAVFSVVTADQAHAASHQRSARRGRGARARRARHGRGDPRRPGRLVLGDQDDPLDHDEGTRGAGRRMRARRNEGGRDRDRPRLARRHLSGLRLEETRGPHAGARHDARGPARRGNAGGRADHGPARLLPRDVARLGRLAAGDRRTGAPG